jgi:hypothetical protein
MFSIKNAVYVAIMQVGVIVVGVLAAGLCEKVRVGMGARLPPAYTIFLNHTAPFLVIPLLWIAVVLWIRSRPKLSDDLKNLAFWSGVFVLITLVFFVFYADVTPWFSIMWRMDGDAD